MTDSEVAKIVAVLMVSYPNARWMPSRPGAPGEPDLPGTSTAYERMLRDLDYATTNAAVERLIATSKWPPTVAEIRDAALTLSTGEARPSGEAWQDVLDTVGRVGSYRLPGFSDPIVARCVEAFGWREICLSENQIADRARFIALYDQLAAQERRLQLSEPLPAIRQLRAAQAASQPQLERTGPKSLAASLDDLEWPFDQ